MRLVTFSLILALLMVAASAVPFHFPVTPGTKKCFSEELTTSRYTLQYIMKRALSQFVSITVTSDTGTKLWEQKQVDEEGRALLIPATAGPYTVCFHINKRAKAVGDNLQIEMDLELESIQQAREAKHFSVSTRNVEDPTISQAEYMDRTIRGVKESFAYFRQREAALRNTNESSNTRMLMLTIGSIVILVLVTVFKEYKLQKFLKKKKFLD